jgi:small-conductance mechanosensitive channel
MKKFASKSIRSLVVSLLVLGGAVVANHYFPDFEKLPGGLSALTLLAVLAGIWGGTTLLSMGTVWLLGRDGRPDAEAIMVGKLYRLVSIFVIILTIAYGYGKLGTFGAMFSLFGGMLLGWSLQGPVSGFAAWVLVSLKRPFRPGDRVQFPNLNLTGDIVDIGPMYVVLDQVGGTVGSEEAVGRDILVPNAMLFSQVVINFTARQEAAYMLDEVVVRITYDSNMEKAEQILLDAATEITRDIIAVTGSKPYIRSDLYDYGLYMRLRYQTAVKDRARISYELTKRILLGIQATPSVDLAIPFIYSYRAGLDRKEDESLLGRPAGNVHNVDVVKIADDPKDLDIRDVEQLVHSIAAEGLLQPIVLEPAADGQMYTIAAGRLRFHACKRLGWKTIPAMVRPPSMSNHAPAGSSSGESCVQ